MKLLRLKFPVSCIVEELKIANILVAGFSFPVSCCSSLVMKGKFLQSDGVTNQADATDMITLKNLELAYTVNDNSNALGVRQLIG